MRTRRGPRIHVRYLRGVWLVLAGLTVALAAQLSAAAPAAAHATLDSTTPQQSSELATAPATVSLRFSEAVGISARSVQVLDPSGQRVDRGSPQHPPDSSETVSVKLRSPMPTASYTVVWRVVSADGHPVAGTFAFGVGVPAGAAAAQPAGSPAVTLLDTLIRGASYAGAVLLVGCGFFLFLLWPAGLSRPRPRRLLTAGWLLSTAAAGLLFAVQGPYGAGLGLNALPDPALLGDTITTTYGKLLLLRLVILGFAAALLHEHLRTVPGRARPAAGRQSSILPLAGLAVAFLLSFSLAGHPGQGRFVVLSVATDATHLATAFVWIGGLVILATCLLTRPDRELSAVLPRWSRIAMAAVAVLAVTGTLQALREIGSLAALTGTSYGWLVIGKATGLAVLLLLADQGRRYVNRRWAAATPTPTRVAGDDLRRARTLVGAEVGVAAVVLGLATVLVNTVPADQAYAPPFSATLTARDVQGRALTVLVGADSSRAGATTLHVYAYTTAGAVLPFTTAAATLTEPDKKLGPIRVIFTNAGPGHGIASGVVVPSPGTWTLTAHVQTDAVSDYAASISYRVH